MTIKQLSEKSGISVNTLYSITKRDSKRVDKIIAQRVAQALEIDIVDLIDAEKDVDLVYFNREILKKLAGADGFEGIDEYGKPRLRPGSLAQSIFFAEITGFEDEKYVANRLKIAFKSLNTDGKRKAVERVEELTEIPRYRLQDPRSTASPCRGYGYPYRPGRARGGEGGRIESAEISGTLIPPTLLGSARLTRF